LNSLNNHQKRKIRAVLIDNRGEGRGRGRDKEQGREKEAGESATSPVEK